MVDQSIWTPGHGFERREIKACIFTVMEKHCWARGEFTARKSRGLNFSSHSWVSQKIKFFFPPQAVRLQRIQYCNLDLFLANLLERSAKEMKCTYKYNEHCSKQIIFFFFFALQNKMKNTLVASAFKIKSTCRVSSLNLENIAKQ